MSTLLAIVLFKAVLVNVPFTVRFPVTVPPASGNLVLSATTIFADPSKETPLIVLAVCNLVAVVAFPVTAPVTFPITPPLAVKAPVVVVVPPIVKLPVTVPPANGNLVLSATVIFADPSKETPLIVLAV